MEANQNSYYLLCLYIGLTVGYFAHKVEAWMWRRELNKARVRREQKKRRTAMLLRQG